MALSLRVCATILLTALSMPGVCRAQSKGKPREVQPYPIAGEVHGTPVKETPALTDDDIALLAVRPAANPAGTPEAETPAEPATKESTDSSARPGEEEGGNRGAATADQREATEDSTADAHVRRRRASFPERPERAVGGRRGAGETPIRAGRIAAGRERDRAAASETRADSAAGERKSSSSQGRSGSLTRAAGPSKLTVALARRLRDTGVPAVLQRFPEVRTRGPSLWIHKDP